MNFIINLLERKNLCFQSFHKLCDEFLDEIARGDTNNLEEFQRKRESLIKVLEQLEIEVNHRLNTIPVDAQIPRDVRSKIELLLRSKDSRVKAILDLDLQILAHIDRIKDETIQKLQSLQAGRRTVVAYRSPMEAVDTAAGNKIVDRQA